MRQQQNQGQTQPDRIEQGKDTDPVQTFGDRSDGNRNIGQPLTAYNGIFDIRGSLGDNYVEGQNRSNPHQQYGCEAW